MPELPDITVYIECLERLILGRRLEEIRVASPFLVHSYDPPLKDAVGRPVTRLRRLGKRIVFAFDEDLFWILHLMISGRLQWRPAPAKMPGKIGLAAMDFANGTLLITEAASRKQASLHAVRGEANMRLFDAGGLEILDSNLESFRAVLATENHTLKRALTDPGLFSGIGNAYSDEILHAARLSPVKLTTRLSDDEVRRLFHAARTTLLAWTERLRREAATAFPAKVTAFRDGMAVHGRYRLPCPRCGSPVQRIVHAQNETNYCATCQTGGKLLADRSLSRLLRSDWPRNLEEMEELIASRKSVKGHS
jgi:formamidopyrimidine-DNA glycosylase